MNTFYLSLVAVALVVTMCFSFIGIMSLRSTSQRGPLVNLIIWTTVGVVYLAVLGISLKLLNLNPAIGAVITLVGLVVYLKVHIGWYWGRHVLSDLTTAGNRRSTA